MSFSFAVVSTLPLHIFYFHFCIFVVSVGAVVVWNVKQAYMNVLLQRIYLKLGDGHGVITG